MLGVLWSTVNPQGTLGCAVVSVRSAGRRTAETRGGRSHGLILPLRARARPQVPARLDGRWLTLASFAAPAPRAELELEAQRPGRDDRGAFLRTSWAALQIAAQECSVSWCCPYSPRLGHHHRCGGDHVGDSLRTWRAPPD